MDALDRISDELTETDEGFVPDSHAPVLATPVVVTCTVTTTTLM